MNLVKNIKEIAKNVLINEAHAILDSGELLDDGFTSAVEAILSCKGRVIISGIGKSAIIASKIAATFNSTGTPAIFMHAADAIHGDLGMIQKEDIVIILSKSGNTPEIKVLIPLVKRLGSKIVGLVSQVPSELSNQADFVINATIKEEACPHNLAPTTSTTLHLALGDALAVCLLESRGFSSHDFAKYHPGGSLGKRMYLKVGDIFPSNECPVVFLGATVSQTIIEMTSKRLGATAVVNDDGALQGIITDGDLRRMLSHTENISGIRAEDIMSPQPRTITPDAYAVEALSVMQNHNITQLIVVDQDRVKGFIHLHDLLREGIL